MAKEKIGNFSIAQGSAQGGREYQEDRYFVAPSHLQTAQEAQSFLIEHFVQLGSQTQSYKCGSTASVAVITPDNRLTVANIGDSPIMVFARDKRTGVVRGIDLAECHNLSNSREARKVGEVVSADKANVVTRSFGDGGHLSTEPFIASYDIRQLSSNPDEELFVSVASDGVLHPQAGLNDAQSHAERNIHGRANNEGDVVRRLLANSTYTGCDNATAVVTKIPQHIGDNGLVLGVFDGHGGSADVSEIVCDHFSRAFRTSAPQLSARQSTGQQAQRVEELIAPVFANHGHMLYEESRTLYAGTNVSVDCAVFTTFTPQHSLTIQGLLAERGIRSTIVGPNDSDGFQVQGLRINAGEGGSNMEAFHKMMSDYLGNPFRPMAGAREALAPHA